MSAPSLPPTTRRAALLLALGGLAAPRALADSRPVTVFAAASLKDALDAIVAGWARDTGKAVRVSYAGSSTLAVQIERGAPADIFVSADLEWMDHLDRKGLLAAETRTNLLGNRLVMVGPKDAGPSYATVAIDLRPGVDIAAALGTGRLAVANVDAVPAGRYGKAALESLGAWDAVKNRLAQTDNVRAAALLVARGEAPLGIVYATDAAADPALRVVGTFPESAHPPIVYPAALLKDAPAPDAAAFFAHLGGGAARAVFEAAGFRFLPASGRERF